jgi:tetratricopeptide (TPR) repeat protein
MVVCGQSAYQNVREGNTLYMENSFEEAVNEYRKSLAAEETPIESYYNMGNSYYRQGKFEEAGEYFKMAADRAKDHRSRWRDAFDPSSAR